MVQAELDLDARQPGPVRRLALELALELEDAAHAEVGDAQLADQARLPRVEEGAHGVGHGREDVGPVDDQGVHALLAEAGQRALQRGAHVLGRGVVAGQTPPGRVRLVQDDPALGLHLQGGALLVGQLVQQPADGLLGAAGPVDVRGVQQVDAGLDPGAQGAAGTLHGRLGLRFARGPLRPRPRVGVRGRRGNGPPGHGPEHDRGGRGRVEVERRMRGGCAHGLTVSRPSAPGPDPPPCDGMGP